ncbi:MAG: ArsR/SmtB family transcription factor [Anaerolineae bacterium]
MKKPTLSWDIGTAYDFFISLTILHEPANFGLRAAWAAGMRSRLPAPERETLETLISTVLFGPPSRWIYYDVPAPKDATAVLHHLAALPADERLFTLTDGPLKPPPVRDALRAIITDGAWSEEHYDAYRAYLAEKKERTPRRDDIQAILDVWAEAGRYGDLLLDGLRAFHDVFFAEEERRIEPVLHDGLTRAQALAETLTISELIEELSQGVSVEPDVDGIVFVPTFWSSPFIWLEQLEESRQIICFGARPPDASLVPGEAVPDVLVRSLKALSDPTRLRILHYLTGDPLTPTQLAQRLRLRPPTVVHHLKVLRIAGLVRIRISEGKEKAYAVRSETVDLTFDILRSFIQHGGAELVGSEDFALEEA